MFLQPATGPREAVRLLSPQGTVASLDGLTEILAPGDCLVLNDAATLPASLRGDGFELRLVSTYPFRAVVFGAGDWRDDTDDRPEYPLAVGQVLQLPGLSAEVVTIFHARFVELKFDLVGDDLIAALYRIGRPIQYRHIRDELALWAVQSPWATRPWALETPSAGRAITSGLISSLRTRGVTVVSLTEGAGISATGSKELDEQLPFPERYEVPVATWAAVKKAKRVVAVGTSVVRALESAARGELSGITELHLSPDTELRVVDGLVTGLHEPGTSHRELMGAFVEPETISSGFARAKEDRLLGHEFGDVQLIWRTRLGFPADAQNGRISSETAAPAT